MFDPQLAFGHKRGYRLAQRMAPGLVLHAQLRLGRQARVGQQDP